jgi:hypothetical protein
MKQKQFSFFSEFPSAENRSPLCLINRSVITTVSSASVFSQLLIGVDQHLAVLHPLHYHRRINSNRCLVLCFVSWIGSVGFGILDVSVSESTKSASGNKKIRLNFVV